MVWSSLRARQLPKKVTTRLAQCLGMVRPDRDVDSYVVDRGDIAIERVDVLRACVAAERKRSTDSSRT